MQKDLKWTMVKYAWSFLEANKNTGQGWCSCIKLIFWSCLCWLTCPKYSALHILYITCWPLLWKITSIIDFARDKDTVLMCTMPRPGGRWSACRWWCRATGSTCLALHSRATHVPEKTTPQSPCSYVLQQKKPWTNKLLSCWASIIVSTFFERQ